MKYTFFILLFLFAGCNYAPKHLNYKEQYSHLKTIPTCQHEMRETPYYIIFLVEARHLDYSNSKNLLKTMVKHPDGDKCGDVGHAWIYLKGELNGNPIVVEGGHSGELGVVQAKYLDGIMNYLDYGYSNPTPDQMLHTIYEPNPIKYLWETQNDGFFQKGSGGHYPTFAAKIDLTETQFNQILNFIRPESYPYQCYSLLDHQCSHFLVEVAALANFYIEDSVVVKIDHAIMIGNERIRCWEDPYYSCMVLSTPDVIERSLMRAVFEGKAENALQWYRNKHHCVKRKNETIWDKIKCFPERSRKLIFYFD